MSIAVLELRRWLSYVLPKVDDDKGASLVEYALLLALIAAVAIVAVTFLGEAASGGLDQGRAGLAAN
jgi:Flp pilus assembly pilin Flp